MNELVSCLSPDELLAQATCAIIIEGKVKGAAWLVSDEGHLLTAGHILGTDKSRDEVEVRFEEDVPRKAYKIQWGYQTEMGVDFAVLKIADWPANRLPLPVSLAQEVTGRFKSRGYGLTLIDQSAGAGEFLGPFDPQNSPGNRLFQLRSPELGEGGYSGAAVFSEELEAVVALQIEATEATTGAGRDTILAIPLYRIAQKWKQLYFLVREPPNDSGAPSPGSIDYTYDVFLSYWSGSMFEKWVHTIFLPCFQDYLNEYSEYLIRRPAKIFVKGEMFLGYDISTYTQIALVHSRCLVALCHPKYFDIQSCRYEMAVMLQRDGRLVVPVSLCDGKFFPRISEHFNREWWRDYWRDYNGLVSTKIKDSPKRVELEAKIAKLAEEVAHIIYNVRPWSKDFFDNLNPDESIINSLRFSPECTLPRW